MKNNKEFDFDISANEKIELGLLNNHVHFLTGDIDEDNIEEVSHEEVLKAAGKAEPFVRRLFKELILQY